MRCMPLSSATGSRVHGGRNRGHGLADGGYIGDPAPASVASWATAKGMTAQQAADDINATAAAWRTAQAAIRAARLLERTGSHRR